jgi:hypothetical protein
VPTTSVVARIDVTTRTRVDGSGRSLAPMNRRGWAREQVKRGRCRRGTPMRSGIARAELSVADQTDQDESSRSCLSSFVTSRTTGCTTPDAFRRGADAPGPRARRERLRYRSRPVRPTARKLSSSRWALAWNPPGQDVASSLCARAGRRRKAGPLSPRHEAVETPGLHDQPGISPGLLRAQPPLLEADLPSLLPAGAGTSVAPWPACAHSTGLRRQHLRGAGGPMAPSGVLLRWHAATHLTRPPGARPADARPPQRDSSGSWY